MEKEELDSILKDTSTQERISSLLELYSSLSEKEKEFTSYFSLHCLENCGECCRHFVPFFTEDEALVAAYFILLSDREEEIRERLSFYSDNICPLYKEEGSGHCSLYEGRGLICRLFGASVSLDKNGHLSYRDCKWKGEKRVHFSSEQLEEKRDIVPIMSFYGEKIGEDGEVINDAINKALDKIKLIISFSSPHSA